MDAHSIHLFDESSVIKTTGKRKYGSSEVGKRAIEIQPYASNATFTIKGNVHYARFLAPFRSQNMKVTVQQFLLDVLLVE